MSELYRDRPGYIEPPDETTTHASPSQSGTPERVDTGASKDAQEEFDKYLFALSASYPGNFTAIAVAKEVWDMARRILAQGSKR